MKKSDSQIYKASITGGSLLIRESKIIARILIDNPDEKSWHHAIIIENVLQKRSPESAKNQARLIKKRLTLMKPEFLELINKGTPDVVIQALIAAAIKHSRLLGDFMDKVVRSHWQVFKKRLSAKDWQDYLDTCNQIEPSIKNWTDTTRSKLKQIIFRILAEANYVNNTRSLELLPVSVIPDVQRYLIDNSEDYILNCMEIYPIK